MCLWVVETENEREKESPHSLLSSLMQVENPSELDELMDEAAYAEHCENEEH